MTVKMFGTRNCPDVRAALETIAEKGLDVEFVNIDESTANLKLFLRLRDKAPEFDEVKKKRRDRRALLRRRQEDILRHKRTVRRNENARRGNLRRFFVTGGGSDAPETA